MRKIILAFLFAFMSAVGAWAATTYDTVFSTPAAVKCASDQICSNMGHIRVEAVTVGSTVGTGLYNWQSPCPSSPDAVIYIQPAGTTGCFVNEGFAAQSSGTAPVTSVSGTTNQITASPTTGDVTLSLPSAVIAPGSVAATTSLATGTASGTTGSLALNGTTSGTITVKPQDAAGTYNFNLPTTAGVAGQSLVSGGGSAAAMDWASTAYYTATITTLQAITSPFSGQIEIVPGRRGGTFTWVVGSLPCDAVTGGGDGGTTFCTSDGSGGYLTSGYWQRAYSGAFQTAWWDDGTLDIGQQINAAYAAAPTYGGEIDISPSSDGAPYDFTHGIVMTTIGKCPVVRSLSASGPTSAGANSGSTVLNFTPTSGTALTIDCGYASDNNLLNRAIYNVTLLNNDCKTTGGCGSSAIGVEIGGTNGGDASYSYYNLTVQGFGTGYYNNNSSALVCCENFYNFYAKSNGNALDTNTQAANWWGGFIGGNGYGWRPTVDNGKAAELHFHSTTIVANVLAPVFSPDLQSGFSSIYMTSPHLETSPAISSCQFFGSKMYLTLTGGVMEDGNSTGTCAAFVALSDYSTVSIYGTQINSPRTVTTVVDATNFVTGSIYPVISSPTTITTLVSGTNAGYSNFCNVGPSFTLQSCQQANNAIFKRGLTMDGGDMVLTLPTACTGKPTGTLWNNSNVVNVCP